MSEVKTYVVVDGQTLDTAEYALPQNRNFSDAWALSEDKNHNQIIVIDVEKAKDVWRNKMREARKPILDSLDADFFRAMEDGDAKKQKDIAAQKKLLRDAPALPELAAATTVEEIEAVWPEYLG